MNIFRVESGVSFHQKLQTLAQEETFERVVIAAGQKLPVKAIKDF